MIPKINRYFFLFIGVFILIFLATRLQNLTAIPVFGDEAIYLRWSQVIRSVETLRFIPLTDGKQPLFMWLTIPFFKFISDPLVAGRLLSIISGLVTAITILLITGRYSAPLIYLLIPFAFFFDRLATPDTLLSTFGSLALLFSLLLAHWPRLDLSLILGGILGLAWLTKSPAIFFIILSFITFTLYNFRLKSIKFFIFPLISIILAFIIYNILRLGPQFHQIAIRNQDYVWTISDIISHPLDPLKPHLSDIATIWSQYIGWPLLFLLPLPWLFRRQSKLITTLILWSFLPLIANAVFAKVFTARYILYTLPPLICLLALGFSQLSTKWASLILGLSLLPNLFWLYQASFRPQYLQLPSTETGYLQDWTSGWGISQAAKLLRQRAQVANVIVGTEGNFGTLPDGLQIYTNQVPQLTVVGVGLGFDQIPQSLINAKNFGDEVYLLINQSRNQLTLSQLSLLRLVAEYPKPGNDKLILFQL